MDFRLLHLIATVLDARDQRPSRGPGHPPSDTIRVVATLRRFLREGTPWRSLNATPDQASGATLRRCLRRWAERGLLAKVHALLVGMLRGHPDLILNTCLVRAKRGGDLTGPNPTDRGKRGTKYHIATDGDGVPVACLATAANVNDTLLFERQIDGLAKPVIGESEAAFDVFAQNILRESFDQGRVEGLRFAEPASDGIKSFDRSGQLGRTAAQLDLR